MNTFLFILKMLGVAMTARATIVGLFKHEVFENIEIKSPIIGGDTKIVRRLTKHGKRAILWAVIGVLTSLAAQGIEQSLNIKRARESAANTQTQMLLLSNSVQREEEQLRLAHQSLTNLDEETRLANRSLRYIEQLLTPLESVTISATYEFPTNSPWTSKLLHHITRRAAIAQEATAAIIPTLNFETLRTNYVPPPPSASPPEFRLSARIVLPGEAVTRNRNNQVPRAGIFGMVPSPKNTNVILFLNPDDWFFTLGPDDIPGVKHCLVGTNIETRIEPSTLTNEFWMSALMPLGGNFLAHWTHLVSGLAAPDMRFDFTRKGVNPSSTVPDLTIFGTSGAHPTDLFFSQKTGKLTLTWESSSSITNWTNPQPIHSIAQLAEANLRVSSYMPNRAGFTHVGCLRQIFLRFRASTLTLTNFHALNDRDDSWVETILPNRTNIISTQDLE